MARRKLSDASPTGALDERRLPDGRRKIKLRRAEREALARRQRAEAAAALFLDLETGRTWADIAQELDLSPAQLKDLTKTPEFDAAYNMLFAELGHDPRFRAVQGALADMLPLAVRELKNLLTLPGTPAGVRLKAAEKIMDLNGISKPQQQHSDRQELVRFLVEHRINFEDLAIPVPPEYAQTMRSLPEGVVEGEVIEPAGQDVFDIET
jgi:hypothetical protein